MREFLKFYFKIILPVSLVISFTPLIILLLINKFSLNLYLEILFIISAIFFLLGIGSFTFKPEDRFMSLYYEREYLKEREKRTNISLKFLFIGLTVLLINLILTIIFR